MVEPTQAPVDPVAEPFGYWIEQKGAEPALLRKPAYIPEPSPLRSVTPVYAADALEAISAENAKLTEKLKEARVGVEVLWRAIEFGWPKDRESAKPDVSGAKSQCDDIDATLAALKEPRS